MASRFILLQKKQAENDVIPIHRYKNIKWVYILFVKLFNRSNFECQIKM